MDISNLTNPSEDVRHQKSIADSSVSGASNSSRPLSQLPPPPFLPAFQQHHHQQPLSHLQHRLQAQPLMSTYLSGEPDTIRNPPIVRSQPYQYHPHHSHPYSVARYPATHVLQNRIHSTSHQQIYRVKNMSTTRNRTQDLSTNSGRLPPAKIQTLLLQARNPKDPQVPPQSHLEEYLSPITAISAHYIEKPQHHLYQYPQNQALPSPMSAISSSSLTSDLSASEIGRQDNAVASKFDAVSEIDSSAKESPVPSSIQQLAEAAFVVSTEDMCDDVTLSEQDIEKLINTAKSNRNQVKAKRDTAMLYLLLDLKLACQKIADLKYRDVLGMINGTSKGIYRYPKGSEIPSKIIKCQPQTTQAIMDWIEITKIEYGWEYDAHAPLFVPLSVFDDNQTPKRMPLKRDAISKVFATIKTACGVQMTKEMINRIKLP